MNCPVTIGAQCHEECSYIHVASYMYIKGYNNRGCSYYAYQNLPL